MKTIFCLIYFLLFFVGTVIADGYTYTNPTPNYDDPYNYNYDDPYYYPPYNDEGAVLTPVNPSYPDNSNYPSNVYPRTIVTVPNPPPVNVYPDYPYYPDYPDYPDYSNYPDYPNYSTYPITFDRGSNYRSGLSTYYVGENVSLNLTAVDHGNLYLFVIDPNGSMRQLLPNYNTRSYSYPVTSGKSYHIPEYGARYKLIAVEPKGYHKLIGLLVSSHYGQGYYSQGSYSQGSYSQGSDLFSGIYSESSLSSRIDHLHQYNNLKIFRYEGQLLVQ